MKASARSDAAAQAAGLAKQDVDAAAGDHERAGLVGGTGQLLLTEALRRAPVAVVAPFDYSQLIWAGIIGYLVWDEIPRAATIAGALVVAGSGVYILYRETRRLRRGA